MSELVADGDGGRARFLSTLYSPSAGAIGYTSRFVSLAKFAERGSSNSQGSLLEDRDDRLASWYNLLFAPAGAESSVLLKRDGDNSKLLSGGAGTYSCSLDCRPLNSE